jgi:hypothetical protein
LLIAAQDGAVFFIRPGEGSSGNLPYNVLTLAAGWWAIPWGAFTIGAVKDSLRVGTLSRLGDRAYSRRRRSANQDQKTALKPRFA